MIARRFASLTLAVFVLAASGLHGGCSGSKPPEGAGSDGGEAGAAADGARVLPDGAHAGVDSASGGHATAPATEGGTSGGCLGASLLATLGKDKLVVGGTMQPATAKLAPFDLQYVYISGSLPDGTGPCSSCASGCSTGGTTCANTGPGCGWWGCWQYDQNPPGDYVRTFDSTCQGESPAQIPMYSYYVILQASGVAEGAPEVTQAAADKAFMARYLGDFRFLMQQIGSSQALVQIEPDFWGYAEQQASDPTTLPAAVATADPTDCGAQPDTIAGMGRCMIAIVRKYAPKALVGLHASAWSTDVDVSMNGDATLDVAGEAAKTAAFLSAAGEDGADFVVVETSDRDAGYYQTVESRDTWWDATNAKLPTFHQDFAWVKALTEALSKPAFYWQTPLGNASQNNTANHYQDNRVDYFLGHMSELAGAHAIGAAFGPGQSDQTLPETDGSNFVDKANAYYKAGGQALCP